MRFLSRVAAAENRDRATGTLRRSVTEHEAAQCGITGHESFAGQGGDGEENAFT